jgi:glyoxylate reductase
MAAARQQFRLLNEPRDTAPADATLGAGIREADAAICTLTDRIDASMLAAASRLTILANYAVGYNNIDLAAASARGIVVTNTPDVLTDATADLTWALLLAVARRVAEGDAYVRSGDWSGWAPTQMLGTDVSGKTLGIVGMGRIGQAVAQRAIGFNMRIRYTSRAGAPLERLPSQWESRPLPDLLKESDFVSLHVPLTTVTHHLIGARQLALMKPTRRHDQHPRPAAATRPDRRGGGGSGQEPLGFHAGNRLSRSGIGPAGPSDVRAGRSHLETIHGTP